jgi:hypothetical protein
MEVYGVEMMISVVIAQKHHNLRVIRQVRSWVVDERVGGNEK